MSKHEPSRPRICDYEGSNYRTEFWENKGRDYEDQVERRALRRLLPSGGRRLLEIGAGFGRLTGEYEAYGQVVLLDYSLSQLQYAQDMLGRSPRFVYVAADAYQLPFQPGVFDAATMIRVVHHMADAPRALVQIRRALVSGGFFILEFANKRNLKAMVRYALKRQRWSPYDLAPVEFVELNFDFHPDYIRQALSSAGFTLEQRLPVSFLRLGWLKDHLPTETLVGLDTLLQDSGLLYAPSIFTRSRAAGPSPDHLHREWFFACPSCGGELALDGDTISCKVNGQRWAVRDGIYDFKAPLD